MGLINTGLESLRGALGGQWADFFTAPPFDEQTLVAPAVFTRSGARRRWRRGSPDDFIADGSRIAVPENTAVIITDGGRIVSASVEPGYFVFRNDGQPSVFAGAGVGAALIRQSWEQFRFGGQLGAQQQAYFINLREIRNVLFGTPGPLPYRDFSLVPPGAAQAPVLRLRARGQYSIRVADPLRFFQNFLPANRSSYSLADDDARAQLSQEFIAAFQAALQALSRTTDIASLATHGTVLASHLTSQGASGAAWLPRFGIEVVSVAISAIEYDEPSRELMDQYNKGALLTGDVGRAYSRATVSDAALAMGESGAGSDGMIGLAMGLGSMNAGLPSLSKAGPSTEEGGATDPVVVLGQLKSMLDRGLITVEQYDAKRAEVLRRM